MPVRRPATARALALALLLPVVAPTPGCGRGGGEAMETETAKEHMKMMKADYGKQTADMYRNKKAAPPAP